jgi:hypothetical protein
MAARSIDLEVADVSETSWEQLASQMDPDFSLEGFTAFCSTTHSSCGCCIRKPDDPVEGEH